MLLLLGCVTVSWMVERPPPVPLPDQVELRLESPACAGLRQAMIPQLERVARLKVVEEAEVAILLSDCEEQVVPHFESELRGFQELRSDNLNTEQRRYSFDGQASAQIQLGVWRSTREVQSSRTTSWRQADDLMGADMVGASRQLQEDLAAALIEELVPPPEEVFRRWYPSAKPGSAEALHNAAVDAERAGKLLEALALAEQAASLSPRPPHLSYLRLLTDLAQDEGLLPPLISPSP
jgi:hypothetical protein